MRIRPEQLAALEEESRRAFEERLADHVSSEYGDSPCGTSAGVLSVSELHRDSLLGMVHYSVEKANRYDITWESSAAAFTTLMFLVGPAFDEHPEIRRELVDVEVPKNSRVDHLGYAIPKSVWQEAKEAQHPEAWSRACPSLAIKRLEGVRA